MNSVRHWLSRSREILVLFGVAAALVVVWLVCHIERARSAHGRQCMRGLDACGRELMTCTSEIP